MKFYDTNALILLQDKIFEEKFCISSKSLEELEHIKTSANKDGDVKFAARQITRLLFTKSNDYETIFVGDDVFQIISSYQMELSPDNIICASAVIAKEKYGDIKFVTDDVLCALTAEKIFGLNVRQASETPNEDILYNGYVEHIFTNDEEMAYFYEHLDENILNLNINEYALLKSCDNVVVDKVKWDGTEYKTLVYKNFKSSMFGVVKPMDDYQQMVFDSIANNDITVITGKAGSGKTTLPMAYAMQQLESQKFRKLVVVYSFEPLKNAKQLGYIKGDTNTKLLETASIGGILSSKMGDKMIVERMLASGSLEIVPTANIRGVEFTDSIVFLTEAQNLDTYTLKTVIQRCKSGCKLIVEGDVLEQSDIRRESGLFRMIETFKGYDGFGAIKLKNSYRSKICEIADKM